MSLGVTPDRVITYYIGAVVADALKKRKINTLVDDYLRIESLRKRTADITMPHVGRACFHYLSWLRRLISIDSNAIPIAFGVALLGAMATYAQSARTDTEVNNAYLEALPLWQKVLATYVDEQGRTDFKALAKRPGELRRFIDTVESVSPQSHPALFPRREDVIAYHINAYNAQAMYGVIERGIPEGFTSFFARASFFRFRDITIGGVTTNLHNYENRVIRPLNEPRVHFALNCMVKDCPRLPRTVFKAEFIEQQLQAAAREFFSKPRHIHVDHDKRELHLSSIMKFYTEDFVASGNKQDLIQYVSRYIEHSIPADYRVKYIPYDWRINQQPSVLPSE